MYRLLWILCVVPIILTCSVQPSAAAKRQRARPGSFVYYATYSVTDLVEQVTNNPTVAKRYAKHFGVSQDKLADYFRKNLKVITLRAPTKVTTYFVSKHNRVLSKQRTLPAGRRVFVTVGDKLFLEVGCGNPVTKQMPVVKTEVKPSVETIAAPPVTDNAESIIEEIMEPVVEPEVVAQLPPVLEAVVPPIEAFRSAPSILQFVEALAPVVAGLQYVQASRDETTVVPEPGSLLPVALASISLAGCYVRSRRARR